MAGKTEQKTAKPNPAKFVIDEAELDPVSRGRTSEPSPLEPYVLKSFETGKSLRVRYQGSGDEAEQKNIGNMLRKAAKDNGLGLTVQIKPDGVRFKAKLKQKTAYTVKDVRDWARERGMTVPEKGKLPPEIRVAYRKAHNLYVKEDKQN